MNSAIKVDNPDALLLAEVYQPLLYRDYIHKGKMDYLYDKVELYDTLKQIMQGGGSTDSIVHIQNNLSDIEHHMLHFLENHDEQRIACREFAGDARRGKPAMVISATISTAPTLIYFGQEVGEPAEGSAGQGSSTRTTIYDYWSVPNHVRWVNDGEFDGGQLSQEEKELRDFYKRLLNFTLNSKALTGTYREIHSYNRKHTQWYNDRVFSYVRWKEDERLLVVVNFDSADTFGFSLRIQEEIIGMWGLKDGQYTLEDQLGDCTAELIVKNGTAETRIDIEPLESFIFKLI
jgi:hypothetical protein